MKYKVLAAVVAAFLMLPIMGTVAYAGGGEEAPPEEVIEPATPEPEPNPFTPAGTGTVIDNATDGDGKEFYTIMTPSENVFYLVIDRQRETENVYFLNAVTEADLLALAEPSESVSAIPGPEPEPDPAPVEPEPAEPEPEPEPEKSSNAGMMIFVVLVVLAGGGAGYYFKIYRPKQQQADAGDDYEDRDEYGNYEGDPYGEDAEDDAPPWDEDDEYSEDDEA